MMPNKRTSIKGQALVEWAIILPAIILITMMIFDFGRIVYYYSVVYNSAREGARHAVVNYSAANLSTQVENKVLEKAVGLNPDDLTIVTVLLDLETDEDNDKDTVRVTISYSFTAITPVVWDLIGTNPVLVSSQADMRLER